MSYLFLDTTDHLVVGLLNSELEWIEYCDIDERKSSAKIHGVVHELAEKHGVDLTKLDGIIQMAGPGSYTGMRVSDGIVQVLEWNKIPTFGLYHFDVPRFLGEESYLWYANAFKGESFIFERSSDMSTKRLLIEAEAAEELKSAVEAGRKVFTHYESASMLLDTHFSSNIIKDFPQKVFPQVIAGESVTEIYYYRSLEDEFRPSSK